jgi:hypothetical protein
VLNLSDRGLDLVDESVVFHALYMNGFVGSEHWPGFQKGSNFGILGAAVHFGWDRLSVKDWHRLSPMSFAAIAAAPRSPVAPQSASYDYDATSTNVPAAPAAH